MPKIESTHILAQIAHMKAKIQADKNLPPQMLNQRPGILAAFDIAEDIVCELARAEKAKNGFFMLNIEGLDIEGLGL